MTRALLRLAIEIAASQECHRTAKAIHYVEIISFDGWRAAWGYWRSPRW